MRFLTLFLLLAIFSCKNEPAAKADNSWMDYGPQDVPAADSSSNTGAYTFNDTILVSINAKDYVAVLKLKPNMPILDLRTEAEYKKGHVWRSTSMDANDKDFMKHLVGLGRNQEYAVYCQTGVKSLEVAEEMKRQGFLRIYHLQKGLNYWGESGQALQLK